MPRFVSLAVCSLALCLGTTAFAQSSPQTSGGGWFTVPPAVFLDPAQEANLGFNAKYRRDGAVQGHLNYHNRTTELTVSGPIQSLYPSTCGTSGEPSVVFAGNCEDGSCSFEFEIVDNGEPGKGRDLVCRFSVVDNEDGGDGNVDRLLSGGNFQVR